MGRWTGVVLALREPGSDGLVSRLSTYLHPLAGRPLVWHTAHALTSLKPPPARVVVVAGPELPLDVFHDLPVEVRLLSREEARRAEPLEAALEPEGPVLVVDGAAPTVAPALQRLVDADDDVVLEGPGAVRVAAKLPAERLHPLAAAGGMTEAPEEAFAGLRRVEDAACVPVVDRATLARASGRIRDRLVGDLMRGGVTFLLPATVMVDVDVRIGRDSLVYPGVVLEGQTSIGEEAVIGPYCRVISSWIGKGAELKGFNYVSHTNIRNRAILEAHVRRGFD